VAVAPKIGLNSLSPVNRMAAFGPVATLDAMPVEELAEKAAIVNDGATFYYEDLLDEQGRAQADPDFNQQTPERRINTGLITGTTQSFADAFNLAAASNAAAVDNPAANVPQTTVTKGIGVYEQTARVIHQEEAPRGDSLNFSI